MNAALLSSQNMNWCTPQDFFDKLNAEFHFALDVAATERSTKVRKFFHARNGRVGAVLELRGGGVLQSTVWT